MKWLSGLAVGLLVAAAVRADTTPKHPSPKDELQRFQGTWLVEAWAENGRAIAADDLKERGVFFGGNVFIFRRGGKVYQAGSVQLDPSKTPRTINLSVKEGPGKDGVMLGVYALDGDTLKLSFDTNGQIRPGGFKPDAPAGVAVVTLRKPKPPADERMEIVGRYRSEVFESSGKVVTTEANIERRGDAYLVTYTQGEKLLFVATAMRRGDQLSMCWVSSGQVGVSVYKIEKGPKLIGEYTTLAGVGVIGKENLTPWREVD